MPALIKVLFLLCGNQLFHMPSNSPHSLNTHLLYGQVTEGKTEQPEEAQVVTESKSKPCTEPKARIEPWLPATLQLQLILKQLPSHRITGRITSNSVTLVKFFFVYLLLRSNELAFDTLGHWVTMASALLEWMVSVIPSLPVLKGNFLISLLTVIISCFEISIFNWKEMKSTVTPLKVTST